MLYHWLSRHRPHHFLRFLLNQRLNMLQPKKSLPIELFPVASWQSGSRLGFPLLAALLFDGQATLFLFPGKLRWAAETDGHERGHGLPLEMIVFWMDEVHQFGKMYVPITEQRAVARCFGHPLRMNLLLRPTTIPKLQLFNSCSTPPLWLWAYSTEEFFLRRPRVLPLRECWAPHLRLASFSSLAFLIPRRRPQNGSTIYSNLFIIIFKMAKSGEVSPCTLFIY